MVRFAVGICFGRVCLRYGFIFPKHCSEQNLCFFFVVFGKFCSSYVCVVFCVLYSM